MGNSKMKKLYIVLVCLILMPALSIAAEKKPPILADTWAITPKAGQGAEFYAALKEHIKFRKEKEDPRTWEIYNKVVGDDLNTYYIRSCCFQWADIDTYNAWGDKVGTGKHFNSTVNKYVEHAGHNFSVIDQENSHWPEDTVANYVGVTSYKLKSGSGKSFDKALEGITKVLIDNNWPESWSFFYGIEGDTNSIGLALAYKNYADMAPPTENVFKFVSKHMKSEKKAQKLFDDFSDGIESSTYTIYKKNTSLE
jgi:hypothetical protein